MTHRAPYVFDLPLVVEFGARVKAIKTEVVS